MKVTVNYRGQVRQAAGVASEIVDLEAPCTMAELAARLAQRRGQPLRSFLFAEDGSLRSHILFVVANEQVLPRSAVPLKEGDVVTILPPMAGG